MSNPQVEEMHDIKVKVDSLERIVAESVEAQKETSKSINKLVTHLEVKEERERHVEEKMEGLTGDVVSLKDEISDLKLDRAREEQGRTFIYKYWPWLLVGVGSAGLMLPSIIKALTGS